MLKVNYDEDNLSRITNIVKKGGIIIYPTDTLYGIGCNPFDVVAIRRIFKLKKRDNNPLPVLCENLAQVKKLVYLGEIGEKLAENFWPGGLTIIAKCISKNIPQELTGNSGYLGVRIPNHKCALEIISLCGGILIATSANISGQKTLETPEEINKIFGNSFDVLIYAGAKPSGVQSTVIDVTSGNFRIIREGAITTNKVKKILNIEEK